jgi:sugar/nucleoside kinase (ribokinase family)
LGRVGDDIFGRLILDRLTGAGVDVSRVTVDPTLKTGLGVALCQDNDRAILTYPGSLGAVEPDDITEDFLASAMHLHHGSFFLHTHLQPAMPHVFKRARELGLSTSLDTNWDPDEQWGSTLVETLQRADIILPNEQEAVAISRAGSLDDALTWLRARVPIVAFKRGVEGASVFEGQREWNYRTTPQFGGDSIGAGDSFAAGFLAGWLRELPLEQCLEIACWCGQSVAGAHGGLQGQLSWDDVTRRLEATHSR